MANTYKNAAVVLTTTAVTDLYTTPANTRTIVQSINVANVDGSDRYVTVTWYDFSAGASYTLLYNAFIPAGTSLGALDTPLVLEAGDILRVQASAANTLHATASVLQIDSTSAIVDESVTATKLANGSVTSGKFATGVLPIVVCTSSTRPASPTAGQQIYETDTKRYITYDGTGWYRFQQVVGASAPVTSLFTTSGTHTNFQDITGMSCSVAYGASRRLKATCEIFPYTPGGSNNVIFTLLRGSTTVSTFEFTSAALASDWVLSVSKTVTFDTVSAATETFKLQMRGSGNTSVGAYADAAYPARLVIEDIGPA